MDPGFQNQIAWEIIGTTWKKSKANKSATWLLDTEIDLGCFGDRRETAKFMNFSLTILLFSTM